jgi:hypothetical protein
MIVERYTFLAAIPEVLMVELIPLAALICSQFLVL